MIYRFSDEDIENYRQRTELNQSSIKVILDEGMQAYLARITELATTEEVMYYEEKEHFLIGGAVDYRLSCGEERFNSKYHFSKLEKKPKEKPLSIIHWVYDQVTSNLKEDDTIHDFVVYRELIYNGCNNHEYYLNRRKGKWEEDTRYLELLKSNAEGYWKELQEAKGKIVLSDDQNRIITTIANNFLRHPHTEFLFEDNPNIISIFQMPLYFTIDGVKCKILPDLIRINLKNKIISVIDFKTDRRPITMFNKTIRDRRYDVQGSFYNCGVWSALKQIELLIGKSLEGFSLSKFAFAVESTSCPGVPAIFVLREELIRQAQYGNPEKNILGWRHAINKMKVWDRNNYSVDNIFRATNGVIHVDHEYTIENYIV